MTLPAFQRTLLSPSDVQMHHTLSPDERKVSILFDNLTLSLGADADAPGAATRSLSFALGVKGEGEAVQVTMTVKGAIHRPDRFHTAIAVRMGDQAVWLDGASGCPEDSFTAVVSCTVRPAAGLPLSFWLTATRDLDLRDPWGAATVTIESLDVVFGAPEDSAAG